MTRLGWALVNALLHGLAADERDAVHGDLLELQTPLGRALLDVSGLVLRRQAQLWGHWRPWLAVGGLAIPLALIMARLSRWYAEGSAINAFIYVEDWSSTILESPGGRRDLATVIATQAVGVVTLSIWSWTMGFLIGSRSQATAWVSGAVFALVLFAEFAVPAHHWPGNAAAFELPLYSTVLPLFLRTCFVMGPMLWGLRGGARRVAPGTIMAVGVAIVAALLTARASRTIGFAATVGWWHPRAAWPFYVFQGALWSPIAYLVGVSFWHRRPRTIVAGS
jgi:hypothetical protein